MQEVPFMNTNIYTLFQYLRTLAADRPDLPLLGDEGGWRTAEQCRHCIESGAGLLYSYGLRSRDLVALRCERSGEHRAGAAVSATHRCHHRPHQP